jgi:hypothetical protein
MIHGPYNVKYLDIYSNNEYTYLIKISELENEGCLM